MPHDRCRCRVSPRPPCAAGADDGTRDDHLHRAFADLSWLAIGIATLAYYLLGALWFTPLFGAAWDTAIGHTRVRGERFSAAYYVVPLVSSLLVTVAMAVLVGRDGDRAADGRPRPRVSSSVSASPWPSR